jgi:polyphosphate kinase
MDSLFHNSIYIIVMNNKIISFVDLPIFEDYKSSLFPKSKHRDFKLIMFQLGVLVQAEREWVRPVDRLFKNFFVSSNMRELMGDRVSRIIDRINLGEKYGNGERPRDIYESLRKRFVDVKAMQNEVLISLFHDLEKSQTLKIFENTEIANLHNQNTLYLDALFSNRVSLDQLKILSKDIIKNISLEEIEEKIKNLLFSLESHGLIKNCNFTIEFKKQLIDDDKLLFSYEKSTPFTRWLSNRSGDVKLLLEVLKQNYLLTHLEILKDKLILRATDADVGMAIKEGSSYSFIPFHRELKRVIKLPYQEGNFQHTFVYAEDLIRQRLKQLTGISPNNTESRMVLFVRNVNVPFLIKDRPDERKVLARGVLARDTAEIVMIEVEKGCSKGLQKFLSNSFKFKAGYYDIFPILKTVLPIEVAGRIDARFVGDIYKAVERKDLKYEKYRPVVPHYNSYVRYTMFKDFLFHWPYHGFILDKIVNETIDIYEHLKDASVLGEDKVKLTVYQSLYRTGETSAPMEALERASKAGAEAHLIAEIKARLDELGNFKWARRLKNSGVHVHYSMMKKKIHTKVTVSKLEITQSGLLDLKDFSSKQWQEMIEMGLIEVNEQKNKALVTRILKTSLFPKSLRPTTNIDNILPQEIITKLALTDVQQKKLLDADIRLRISHVGTGNIRENTAKSFEDMNTVSSKPSLGRDCEHMFNSVEARILPNEPEGEMWFGNHLKVHLREKIAQEIAKKEDGYILLKVNQLEDDEMIDLLYKASMSGVQIDLFVRGFNIIRTANLLPLSLTNADIADVELSSDPSRILTNDEARNMWDLLKKDDFIDSENLVSEDYLEKRNQAFILMSSSVGRDKAKKLLLEVLDEAYKMRRFSKNIRLFRVIDRHLEHSRVYVFGKGENPDLIIGSSDIMKRNLRKRLEANRVIKDTELKKQILDILKIYKDSSAHMEKMTANERYYLMDVNQKEQSVQEYSLPLYHHLNRDDGYANKWLLYYYLGRDSTKEIWRELLKNFSKDNFIGDDIKSSSEIIDFLKNSSYKELTGFNDFMKAFIKIGLQKWE